MSRRVDKMALLETIQQDSNLSKEQKAYLSELINSKKYGLVWEEKSEGVQEELRTHIPFLKEDKGKRILNSPSAPNHLIIEGDNYQALTDLCYIYDGKVDVIYIDPPYNTGNKDFAYNDSFVEKDNEFRHSTWLSFMEKRLQLAKRLLSDKGVIFISIDDNEQAQLKLLCDEVFSSSLFVGTYLWKRTSTPPALSYKIRRKLEFVLCYMKQDIPQRKFAQGYTEGGDAPLLNNGNPLGVLTFPKGSVHFNIPDGVYDSNSSRKIELIDYVTVKDGVNDNDFRAKGHFKWGQENLYREIGNGTHFLIKSNLFSLRFQKEEKSTKVPSNIIDEIVSVGTNEDAQKEIEGLNLDFDYSKPSSLIKYLINMPFFGDKYITILDFFAGSGTTLHATMQLNKEDGGKRKCILVTNNENGICENVTYVRNKKVIEGYTTPKGQEVEGLKDNNLRYYKVELMARERSFVCRNKLQRKGVDMLCIKEDIYAEQPTFGKLQAQNDKLRYFAEGGREMLVVLDYEWTGRIVGELKGMETAKKIKVYVSCPKDYPFTEEFEEVAEKVELIPFPAQFLNIYNKVAPRMREKSLDGHAERELTEEEMEETAEDYLPSETTGKEKEEAQW